MMSPLFSLDQTPHFDERRKQKELSPSWTPYLTTTFLQHPSPRVTTGFLGNGHFKKANDWLDAMYGPEGKVDWCKLEESKVET